MKFIEKILVIISLVGVVFSVYFYNENRYAYAIDLAMLDNRLQYKIQADQLNNTKEQYWNMQERFGDNCEDCNEEKKKEMKELKEEMDDLKENIRILKEKK